MHDFNFQNDKLSLTLRRGTMTTNFQDYFLQQFSEVDFI